MIELKKLLNRPRVWIYLSALFFWHCAQVPEHCNYALLDQGQFCFGGNVYNKCNGQEYHPPDGNPCRTYELNVDVNDITNGGHVSRNPNQTNYTAGTRVTVTAAAAEGYTFSSWTGAPDGVDASEAVAMFYITGNVTMTANFAFNPFNPNITYEKLTDSRDGKKYRTVVMPDGKEWMAENLNYKTDNSWCYDNDDSNCAKYGRLYTWDAAMKACPAGWHLPSDDEWIVLVNAVGGSSTAGTKLKSTVGWVGGGNGTDDYGFSALPGGLRRTDGSFYDVGVYGYWWAATEGDGSYAYARVMYDDNRGVGRYYNDKDYGYSARCRRD